MAQLDALATGLEASGQSAKGLLARLLPRQSKPAPRGLYIYGDVGRGKSMLMDLFFATVRVMQKRRVHFHAFMQEIHAQRTSTKSSDVISEIADRIAAQARLLCLDEMQIVDIADAMIIGRLFDALVARGICIVTTSNLPPDQLYKDGLNRQLFLPFIAKLQQSLDVIALESDTDYRLNRIATRQTFIAPLDASAHARLLAIWNDLTDSADGEPMDIDILGRKLHVPKSAHLCAWFTFDELCAQPLGPPDYLALAHTFRTIFIEQIPVLAASQRNETKRFILLIDTLYDCGTHLAATAAAEPEQLYTKGQHSAEFKRTVSRLKEMQSASWWHKTRKNPA